MIELFDIIIRDIPERSDREIMTRMGCPNPLPATLPAGTRNKVGATATSELKLVDKTVVPRMDWEPQQYIGRWEFEGRVVGRGLVHACDIDWSSRR